MKIKTREYLRDIREAEKRGYRRGREEAFREVHNEDLRKDIYDMVERTREQTRELFLKEIKGKAPAKHANEPANVGDEIAAKCF